MHIPLERQSLKLLPCAEEVCQCGPCFTVRITSALKKLSLFNPCWKAYVRTLIKDICYKYFRLKAVLLFKVQARRPHKQAHLGTGDRKGWYHSQTYVPPAWPESNGKLTAWLPHMQKIWYGKWVLAAWRKPIPEGEWEKLWGFQTGAEEGNLHGSLYKSPQKKQRKWVFQAARTAGRVEGNVEGLNWQKSDYPMLNKYCGIFSNKKYTVYFHVMPSTGVWMTMLLWKRLVVAWHRSSTMHSAKNQVRKYTAVTSWSHLAASAHSCMHRLWPSAEFVCSTENVHQDTKQV